MPSPGMVVDCSSLLCYEDDNEELVFCRSPRTRDELASNNAYMENPDPLDVDALISDLLLKESSLTPEPQYVSKLATLPPDRHNTVYWLLKVHEVYGFGPVTAALAVNYLDCFLSRYRKMDNGKAWMFQLLSVACLSLAAKMEETEVPLLLDLQEGAEYVFEPRTIQRMELLVLSTLDWRMNSVTPFSYTDLLITKLGAEEQYRYSLSAGIRDLILNTLKDTRFVEYRASETAVAAALCAAREQLPFQPTFRPETLFLDPPFCKEACMRCWKLMYRLFVEPYSPPRGSARLADNGIKRVPPSHPHPHPAAPPQSPLRVLDAAFSFESDAATATAKSLPLSSDPATPSSSKKRRVFATEEDPNLPNYYASPEAPLE